MARVGAVSLPILAALIVAVIAWRVLGTGETGRSLPALVATTTPEPTPPTMTPALRQPGDVCQSFARRPTQGSPQKFADEYTQQRDVMGVRVVANAGVSERALDVAAETIRDLFRSQELIEPLVAESAYVIIMNEDQRVLDLPEFKCLVGASGSDIYDHVCGVADRADYPVVTVSELDLTGDRRGPCRGLNVLYHELGHLVQGWALGPADYVEVRILYQAARDSGSYEGEYAMHNVNEYFAEATQAYFLHTDPAGRKDRDWLKAHDPGIYELLKQVYGD